jgi:single-stranded DNA-binding protein
MNKVIISGRTGRETRFTPAYNNGKDVSAMLTGSLAISDRYRQKSGKDAMFIDFTLFGAGAVEFAAWISPGKQLIISGEIEVFKSRTMDDAGNVIVNSQGVPIMRPRAGIRVDEVELGPDSEKQLQAEIQAFQRGERDVFAIRPPHWNVAGTPDAAEWAKIMEARRQTLKNGYQSGYQRFGYAAVREIPRGAVLLDWNRTGATRRATTGQAAGAVAGTAAGRTHVPQAYMPQTVATPPAQPARTYGPQGTTAPTPPPPAPPVYHAAPPAAPAYAASDCGLEEY